MTQVSNARMGVALACLRDPTGFNRHFAAGHRGRECAEEAQERLRRRVEPAPAILSGAQPVHQSAGTAAQGPCGIEHGFYQQSAEQTPMDTLAPRIAPDLLYEYLAATQPNCVSLFRDMRLDNRDETRVLCGTGTFVRRPGETRILLVTAAHCIPRTEQDAPLPLYAGVDDTVQLDLPFVEVLREEPDRGSDLAFFVADDIVSIAGGEKRPIELAKWPPDDPAVGDLVVVVGYPRMRMERTAVEMTMKVRFDAYPGRVTSVDRFTFYADIDADPPYSGAVPIDEAAGLSGGPCFRVSGTELRWCGLHRAMVAGPRLMEQRLSVAPGFN